MQCCKIKQIKGRSKARPLLLLIFSSLAVFSLVASRGTTSKKKRAGKTGGVVDDTPLQPLQDRRICPDPIRKLLLSPPSLWGPPPPPPAESGPCHGLPPPRGNMIDANAGESRTFVLKHTEEGSRRRERAEKDRLSSPPSSSSNTLSLSPFFSGEAHSSIRLLYTVLYYMYIRTLPRQRNSP